MLRKGFRLFLEPDRFETHAALARLLSGRPGWVIVDGDHVTTTPPEPTPAADPDADLMPHHREIVEKLRSQLQASRGESS